MLLNMKSLHGSALVIAFLEIRQRECSKVDEKHCMQLKLVKVLSTIYEENTSQNNVSFVAAGVRQESFRNHDMIMKRPTTI